MTDSEDISGLAQNIADLRAKTKMPAEIAGTASVMTEEGMSVLTQAVPTVPDIESGGDRAPRLGCYLSLQPVPYLDKQVAPGGPMFVPRPPVAQFIMADDYEKLLARIIFEATQLLETTQREVAKMEKESEENPETPHPLSLVKDATPNPRPKPRPSNHSVSTNLDD